MLHFFILTTQPIHRYTKENKFFSDNFTRSHNIILIDVRVYRRTIFVMIFFLFILLEKNCQN